MTRRIFTESRLSESRATDCEFNRTVYSSSITAGSEERRQPQVLTTPKWQRYIYPLLQALGLAPVNHNSVYACMAY